MGKLNAILHSSGLLRINHIHMNFTEDELLILNGFFNSQDSLPTEVEVLSVKLREHFNQDISTETLEVPVAPETAPTPVEEAPVDAVPDAVPEVAPTTDSAPAAEETPA